MISSSAAALAGVPRRWLGALWRTAPLISRIVAALFGGYALAALGSVAALALPMDKPQAVLTGMQASFLIYTLAVIWVFAVRSAKRAWVGLGVAAVPMGLAALWVLNGQGAA